MIHEQRWMRAARLKRDDEVASVYTASDQTCKQGIDGGWVAMVMVVQLLLLSARHGPVTPEQEQSVDWSSQREPRAAVAAASWATAATRTTADLIRRQRC